jgi:DNA-binding beta-propeller fold protein YncE
MPLSSLFKIVVVATAASLAGCGDSPSGSVSPIAADNAGASDAPNDTAASSREGAASDTAEGIEPDAPVQLVQIGRFHHTDQSPSGWDESAAEIVAYDTGSRQIFAVNGMAKTVDVLDGSDMAALRKAGVLDLHNGGAFSDAGAPNSVAISNGLVAVAVENTDKQQPGWVYFFQAEDRRFVKRVVAGALPDMVTFTPDGRKVLAANEGEPNADYSIDPEGSLSIIPIIDGFPADEAALISFAAFNAGGPRAAELPAGVRIFGNYGRTRLSVSARIDEATIAVSDSAGIEAGHWLTIAPDPAAEDGEPLAYQVAAVAETHVTLTKPLDSEATYTPGDTADITKLTVFLHDGRSSVSQDLEPEYIAVSPDSTTAFVTLQENNALAIIDLQSNEVTSVVCFGVKDHNLPGNELDASDSDGVVNIRNWPVQGLYMPDAIASYAVDGEVFLVTANEGDSRAYEGLSEEIAFRDNNWGNTDDDAILYGADFSDKNGVGDLLTTVTNDLDRDGVFDTRYSFGARSFSLWNAQGQLVWDSGHDFAVVTAARYGLRFNNDNKKTEDDKDGRSDAKGAEPEALAVGRVGQKTYAFVGLERMGGIMVYDITTPDSPRYVTYTNNRDIDRQAADFGDIDGDYGPEGLAFVSADVSPNGSPLLIVAHEVSGTTTVYRVDIDESQPTAPKPGLEDLSP